LKIKSFKPKSIVTKGWLTERFGDCYAQLSTDTTLKLKSSIKDVFRVLHGSEGFSKINKITNKLPMPPQGVTDLEFVFGYKGSGDEWIAGALETDEAIISFVEQFPKEWEIVQLLCGLTRNKSTHPCSFVIADEPISNFIPLVTLGGNRITQYTAPAVESSGGLKMDFLIVNSLKDINSCIELIQNRHGKEKSELWAKARSIIPKNEDIPGMPIAGKFVPASRCVPFKGQYFDIWDMPEDQAIFRDICEGNTETVFQLNTHGAKNYLRHFNVTKKVENGVEFKGLSSILDLATFTSLDRPGPLDYYVEDGLGGKHNMLIEYARRARGLPAASGSLDVLRQELPETLGVLCYQEQISKIYKKFGGTTAAEADEFRVHTSKKQLAKVLEDKKVFIKGAYEMLGPEIAEKLWDQMVTFANYSFNLSHAVCYVVISYACAWLKFYYSLEWWTSVLQNADRNEINEKFWAHCGKYISLPDIKTSTSRFEIEGDKIRAPLWLLKGVGEKAQIQLSACSPFENLLDLCQKVEDWRLKNATTVKRKKKDKKTGEETEVESRRLASSALNSRVVNSLIISGAMDSLFADIEIDGVRFAPTIAQKIAAYDNASYQVTKKKKKKAQELNYLDPLTIFQMKKEILPALTDSLTALAKPLIGSKLFHPDGPTGKAYIHHKLIGRTGSYRDYRILEADMVEKAQYSDLKSDLIFAAVGYVNEDRRFSYTREGKQATSSELTIDFGGAIVNAVKWPLEGGLPPPFNVELKGAVVVALLSKRPGKKVAIDDLLLIKAPLDAVTEEPQQEEEND
jgi:DNA polymerase III alpha subunit